MFLKLLHFAIDIKLCENLAFDRKILNIKVRLSRSKKIFFYFAAMFPLKMMKSGFYFILKAVFILKIFNFLS